MPQHLQILIFTHFSPPIKSCDMCLPNDLTSLFNWRWLHVEVYDHSCVIFSCRATSFWQSCEVVCSITFGNLCWQYCQCVIKASQDIGLLLPLAIAGMLFFNWIVKAALWVLRLDLTRGSHTRNLLGYCPRIYRHTLIGRRLDLWM